NQSSLSALAALEQIKDKTSSGAANFMGSPFCSPNSECLESKSWFWTAVAETGGSLTRSIHPLVTEPMIVERAVQCPGRLKRAGARVASRLAGSGRDARVAERRSGCHRTRCCEDCPRLMSSSVPTSAPAAEKAGRGTLRTTPHQITDAPHGW